MKPWESNKNRLEDSSLSSESSKERPDHLVGGMLLGASVLFLLALMGRTSREREQALAAPVEAPKLKHEPDPFIGYVPVKEREPVMVKVKAKPTRDHRAIARVAFAAFAVLFTVAFLVMLVAALLSR